MGVDGDDKVHAAQAELPKSTSNNSIKAIIDCMQRTLTPARRI
jgi:hypothetical protein